MVNWSTKGSSAAIVVGIVFGVNAIVVKCANLEGVKVLDLLLIQYLFTLLWFGGKSLRHGKEETMHIPFTSLFRNIYCWIVGVCGVLTALLYYTSIQMTDPSIASLGLYQYPWMLYILSIFIGKSRWQLSNALGIVAIWIGVLLLLGVSAQSWQIGGLLYGVGAGLSFAVYVWALQKIPNHPLGKLHIVLISLVLVIISYLLNGVPSKVPNISLLGYGFISAILGQIATFELLTYSAVRVPPTLIAIFITLELPIAVSFSWIIWGPAPHIVNVIGLVVMVGSVCWVKLSQEKIETGLELVTSPVGVGVGKSE